MELQKGGSIDDEILHLVLVPRPRLLLPHHRRQQARKIASFQTLPRDRQELHVHKNMKYSGKTDPTRAHSFHDFLASDLFTLQLLLLLREHCCSCFFPDEITVGCFLWRFWCAGPFVSIRCLGALV
jgi:hypothetical protein